MKVNKLTKKAQDIVNQVMSADAVDISHGPYVERIVYGSSFLSSKGLEIHVDIDEDIIISNETLNEATIVDGIIQIDADHIKDNEYGDMTIILYKLSKIAAL